MTISKLSPSRETSFYRRSDNFMRGDYCIQYCTSIFCVFVFISKGYINTCNNITACSIHVTISLWLVYMYLHLIYAFSVATMKIHVMSLSLPHNRHNIRSAPYILWQTIYPRSIIIAKYRIMAVLKAETDVFTSSTASLIGWAVIQIIMFVETFKTGIVVCIGNVTTCDLTLTDNFQYQSGSWC